MDPFLFFDSLSLLTIAPYLGSLRMGQTLTTSTTRQARMPNWAPAGPASALWGMKMAEARLPAIPDPK